MSMKEKMARAMLAKIQEVDEDAYILAPNLSASVDLDFDIMSAMDAILEAMMEPDHAFGLYVVAGDALKGQSLVASQERAFAVEKAWSAMLTAIRDGA